MSKFIVFLADGFEEIEALTPVDYLRRAEVEVDMVSITDKKEVIGAHNIKVMADMTIDEVDYKVYEGAYIPGGIPGATNLRDSEKVINLIKKINENKKILSAICAGPIVLDKAGLLEGKKVTSYPTFEEELKNFDTYLDSELVVVDDNIITSRGAATAIYLSFKLIEILKGKDLARELMDSIQQDKVERYYSFKM